jgi:hypothetical protein
MDRDIEFRFVSPSSILNDNVSVMGHTTKIHQSIKLF